MEYVEVQGERIPALGLGTWQLQGDRCRRAVAEALDLGYRHVDTAQMYGNEAQVGAGLRDAGVDRDEVFLVTKIANQHHAADRVRSSTERSVADLDVDAVDLLLVHWPVDWDIVDETLDAMLELRERGLVRHLGVSNFSPDQLDVARRRAPILADQVEHHPFSQARAVRDHAAEVDVALTAYSPLARGAVLDDPVLREIADAHARTPSQVALRWLLDQPKVTAIPKASSRDHLAENLDVFDFALEDEERRRIDALDRG